MRSFASFRRAVVASLLAMGAASQASAADDPAVLLAQLQALPNVASAAQAPSTIPDTLFFRLSFRQPVDHAHPEGPSFLQRATLLHRDRSRPVVLATEGYAASMLSRQGELAFLLQANQLRVEHRFFDASTPAVLDWTRLDIAQAAADHHALVQGFKGLYGGKWVATGASKGGMTSVYFRALYPDDVDATVAYVAPTSQGGNDARYVQFLAQVGTADCRERLRRFQEVALSRRDGLLALMADGYAALGKARTLEFSILETPFAFWQYQDASLCPEIPGAADSDATLLAFVEAIVGLDPSDARLHYYAPYYYQSATQLGGPRIDERGLGALLNYPRQDIPQNYPPQGVPKVFQHDAMPRIEAWVQGFGERMLFIYGENDPWSTNPFQVQARNDSWRLVVRGAGGNHGANLARLSTADREFALAKLEQWLGVDIAERARANAGAPALDGNTVTEPTRAELYLR